VGSLGIPVAGLRHQLRNDAVPAVFTLAYQVGQYGVVRAVLCLPDEVGQDLVVVPR
jgi:hypothetical protein